MKSTLDKISLEMIYLSSFPDASAAKQTERQETSDNEYLEMMCAHLEAEIDKY